MDSSVAKPKSDRQYWTVDDIKDKMSSSKVVVFSKGTREDPRCGFTAQAFDELEGISEDLEIVNVCEDKSIIAALRTVTGRKALPIVVIDGKVVSCSDDLPKMLKSGTLREQVEKIYSSN